MTETSTPPAPAPTTRTFESDGATITYDVRGELGSGVPLLLFGSPMDAGGFPTLASHFTDRVVVTYDPRGTGRSTRHDGHGPITPDDHVRDLHGLVEAIGGGPVDAFGTSGGAVNGLAWVARHPDDVRTLVAHEPPVPTLLPDREPLLRAVDDIADTYQRAGYGAGMAKFIVLVSTEGPVPDDFVLPEVDPAQFGMPADDDGSRGDPLLEQNMRGCNVHELDLDAIRSAPTRVVPARGEGSGQQMAARGATAVAEGLGHQVAMFPGDHGGFMGGEFGQQGVPDAFAARLREVLAG